MDPGRRKFAIVAGSILLLAIAVFIVSRLHRQPRAVSEVSVGNGSFTITLPESGVAQYPQIETMSSQVAGNVGRILVKPGDRVSAGELLATLVNPAVLSDAQSSGAAYRAAAARSQSAAATDTSNVVQAEANVEAARTRLAQAQQDAASGLQSGLGLGESTAAEQRAQAQANVATTATNLREARRLYLAFQDLYANKAVSRDELDQAQAKFEQAQVAYNQARLSQGSLGPQLSRSRTVASDNLRAAQQGLSEAEAALAAARVQAGGGDVAAASAEAARAGSEYAFAQEQANAMQVRAPYDAIVLSVATEKNDPLRPLQPGDAIGIGQPLVTLAARRAFVVRTKVDEQDVINVRIGERVQITGEDFPGHMLGGHVTDVSPIAQKADDQSATGRTVPVTIAVDQPPPFLRDGMSVDVSILTTDLAHAIVVPNEALVRDGGRTYVYVVRNGYAFREPVSVSLTNETSSVIAAGLRDGDVVVARSAADLRDGIAVTALDPASPQPSSPQPSSPQP